MTSSSPKYEARFTRQFADIIDSNKKRDQQMVAALGRGVDQILRSPQSNDGWLRGPLAGQRKKYVGKSRYRISFAVCGECRRLGKKHLNACEFCEQTTDNTVVFFHGGPKKGRHGDYGSR